MITLADIEKRARRQYERYLSSIIKGENIFPLILRSDKALDTEKGISGIHEQLIPLIKGSKEALGYGYTLETTTSNIRHGTITTIKKIEFSGAGDYEQFLKAGKEVSEFKNHCTIILEEFPILKELFIQWPRMVTDNQEKWPQLLAVCRYFKQHSKPNLYIRELPIPVHTKFIENNQGTILKLLQKVAPDSVNQQAISFEGKLGLREKHNLIRIRFLDDRLSILQGFDEIGIAETDINKLNITNARVFIIENDITALAFPKVDHSIILFGRGYNLVSLRNISWLKHADVFYWSDLDAQGFEMLSLFRSYFPQTQSFLMGFDTLNSYREDWQTGKEAKASKLLHLTKAENETYQFLRNNNLRLEQEKISNTSVSHSLRQLTL